MVGKSLELLPVRFLLVLAFLHLCILSKRHLAAVCPWARYSIPLNRFPHLHNSGGNIYLERQYLPQGVLTGNKWNDLSKAFIPVPGTSSKLIMNG